MIAFVSILKPWFSAPRWPNCAPISSTFCCGLLMLGAVLDSPSASYEPCNILPPKPSREFRAAWIATVGNIDWPSKPGLSTADQKAELIAILDRAAHLKLNALIFQVRPSCDALYASHIEPWSEYLTGTMGQAPSPLYDPLEFAIDEAHQRGLELHAWFNPYRARHAAAKSPASATHISRTKPQLVRQYGKYLWLDPGEREVQDYSLSVIMDVVKRYDVDGVHIDDYFYPYKETDASGKELEFPDEASWRRFGAGGKLSRDDWRRENVNRFIERVYHAIKAAKPAVKFGVSPFGIWRPGYPPQIEGFDAYAKLYADSRTWLTKGWVDYFAPQLYWGIDPPAQSFSALLKWWGTQNTKGRHLWPGMDSTRTNPRSGQDASKSAVKRKPEEIINQIRLTRSQSDNSGHIHWNMKTLMSNDALDEALAQEVYGQPALIPASPWLGKKRPGKPNIKAGDAGSGAGSKLSWGSNSSDQAWLWLVQTRSAGTWKMQILPGNKTTQAWSGQPPELVAISAIDRFGNAGPAATVQIKR
jgi:uncharacterized lipoprotein YddW (UPF0748 family)